MVSRTSANIPERVIVSTIQSSRYRGNIRPQSWDERVEGIDTIVTTDGRTLRLKSDGQQSPPQVGWVILLSAGDDQSGYVWTLYGIPKQASGGASVASIH